VKNNLLSIDEYRNNPEFYFYKGIRCANKKNLSDAFKNLLKAIQLEPDNSEYKFNIACFLSELQRPKEATRIFNDILLNLNPTMYECYFAMGCNCFEMGDAEKSAEHFEKYLYFESEGEFSEEVSEMLFYLKLYNNISHGEKFINRSNTCLKNGKKCLNENKLKEAVRELYKAISLNPFNIAARNSLTYALIEQKNFERAMNINKTVTIIDSEDVWANCLNIYILSNTRKRSKADKLLEDLLLGEIQNREELLCTATALFVYSKVEDLIMLLEMYVNEYNDALIYSILYLAYALTGAQKKLNKIYKLLLPAGKTNQELMSWLEVIKNTAGTEQKLTAMDEYIRLFHINNEEKNLMYDPSGYKKICTRTRASKAKINNNFVQIVDCAVKHREIMYTQYYEKEIIKILKDCNLDALEQYEMSSDEVEAYSAALEYNYSKQYLIGMEKDELIQKYNISSISFDRAFKNLKYIMGK
jgi:tetratricopeptide (TPR) repeat protein